MLPHPLTKALPSPPSPSHPQAPTLQSLLRSSIKVVGVANSKCMLVSGEGISPDTWKEDLTAKVWGAGVGRAGAGAGKGAGLKSTLV